MKKTFLGIIASLFVLLSANIAQATTFPFIASLSGLNESPPNASPATGSALVTYDNIAHTLLVDVIFSGLVAPNTASHIHCCTAVPFTGNVGVATTVPTFTGFPTGTTSGSYLHLFDLTLASSWNPAFILAHGGTPAGAEADFVAGLFAGTTYLNIHSQTYPAGEIRGFLLTPEPATLTLLGLGLSGLAAARRRRVRKA